MKRVLYIRTGPFQIDINNYNSQEIGLAAALTKQGYSCDVVYYHKRKNYEQVVTVDGVEVRLLWHRALRLLRSGIFFQTLKKNILNQYDYIVVSEYSQIMNVLIGRKRPVFIYNGIYYNLFFIPFMEKIYDSLFIRKINQYCPRIFCKTKASELYLSQKGLKQLEVVGVGIDLSLMSERVPIEASIADFVTTISGQINLLYVGSLTERKNILFLFRVFNRLFEKNQKINLILIGDGPSQYQKKCEDVLSGLAKKNYYHLKKVSNKQLKYIYKECSVFLLASLQEIFGMVLLEAMYYSLPCVCSKTAGAETLVMEGETGYVIEQFDEEQWSATILALIADNNRLRRFGQKAHERIVEQFTWDKIAQKMINAFQEGK